MAYEINKQYICSIGPDNNFYYVSDFQGPFPLDATKLQNQTTWRWFWDFYKGFSYWKIEDNQFCVLTEIGARWSHENGPVKFRSVIMEDVTSRSSGASNISTHNLTPKPMCGFGCSLDVREIVADDEELNSFECYEGLMFFNTTDEKLKVVTAVNSENTPTKIKSFSLSDENNNSMYWYHDEDDDYDSPQSVSITFTPYYNPGKPLDPRTVLGSDDDLDNYDCYVGMYYWDMTAKKMKIVTEVDSQYNATKLMAFKFEEEEVEEPEPETPDTSTDTSTDITIPTNPTSSGVIEIANQIVITKKPLDPRSVLDSDDDLEVWDCYEGLFYWNKSEDKFKVIKDASDGEATSIVTLATTDDVSTAISNINIETLGGCSENHNHDTVYLKLTDFKNSWQQGRYSSGLQISDAEGVSTMRSLYVPVTTPSNYGVLKVGAVNNPALENITTTEGRNYQVQVNNNGVGFVNVPWTGVNITTINNDINSIKYRLAAIEALLTNGTGREI